MWSNIPTNLVLSSVLIWLVGVDTVERGPWWLFANVLLWGRRGRGWEGRMGNLLAVETSYIRSLCNNCSSTWMSNIIWNHWQSPTKWASWDKIPNEVQIFVDHLLQFSTAQTYMVILFLRTLVLYHLISCQILGHSVNDARSIRFLYSVGHWHRWNIFELLDV